VVSDQVWAANAVAVTLNGASPPSAVGARGLSVGPRNPGRCQQPAGLPGLAVRRAFPAGRSGAALGKLCTRTYTGGDGFATPNVILQQGASRPTPVELDEEPDYTFLTYG
jgi:hypothetical protein